MEVEFTARQVRIPKGLRDMGQQGMDRLGRLLGKSAHGSLVFSAQRREQIVELNIQARLQTFSATGKGATHEVALREAMTRAENQVRRHRDRRLATKRLPKEDKVMTAPPVARPKSRASQPEESPQAGRARKGRTTIAVHSFPVRSTVVEPHVAKNSQAIALRPMTIEEAVKDAEFQDRDLLVFRTAMGELYVLHRRRDGLMELVEVP
jgi:putative sigma-54 modulation protein